MGKPYSIYYYFGSTSTANTRNAEGEKIMIISKLKLKNWRSFRDADVPLCDIQFVAGADDSGKSNLLDAFQFLRDLTQNRVGLQKAVKERDGLSSIRHREADDKSEIVIGVSFADVETPHNTKWHYEIGIVQKAGEPQIPRLSYEKIWDKDNELVFKRPDINEKGNCALLEKTRLEQIVRDDDKDFKEICDCLRKISHLGVLKGIKQNDSARCNFETEMKKMYGIDRDARAKSIIEAIKEILPKFHQKNFRGNRFPDEILSDYSGSKEYDSYRYGEQPGWNMRHLMEILWKSLDNDSVFLSDEPEGFLHSFLIESLPQLLHKTKEAYVRENAKRSDGQVLISTHSVELMSGKSIKPKNVLLLSSGKNGTAIKVAKNSKEIKEALSKSQ